MSLARSLDGRPRAAPVPAARDPALHAANRPLLDVLDECARIALRYATALTLAEGRPADKLDQMRLVAALNTVRDVIEERAAHFRRPVPEAPHA